MVAPALRSPWARPGTLASMQRRSNQPLGGVGLLECCFEEGEAAARRGREDRLELRQDRDHEVDRALVPVLVLAEGQPAAGMDPAQRLADMLRPPYVLPADAREDWNFLGRPN